MPLVKDSPEILDCHYANAAHLRCGGRGNIVVDQPEVDRRLGGAYVAAWVWVPAEVAIKEGIAFDAQQKKKKEAA